jgi:nicotinamidase-related amidase
VFIQNHILPRKTLLVVIDVQQGYVRQGCDFVAQFNTAERPNDVTHFREVFTRIADRVQRLAIHAKLAIVQWEFDLREDYLLFQPLERTLLHRNAPVFYFRKSRNSVVKDPEFN